MKKIIFTIMLIALLTFANGQESAIQASEGQAQASTCCLVGEGGEICQPRSSSTTSTCPGGLLQTSCEEVLECQTGCCIDNNNGFCTERATRGACERGGNTWTDNPSCNIAACQKNCCIVGDRTYYVTESECTQIASGQTKNYVQVEGENQCLMMGGKQKRGACVQEGNDEERSCSFETREKCNSQAGQFHENILCSNEELNTICTKQDKTSCITGLDAVYWIDSCGNRENIWEGNSVNQRESSWNAGVVKSEPTCDPSNSQCGNCNRFTGSRCAVNDEGAAFCRSLDCKSAPDSVGTAERKNGESWCVYESATGEGNDVPGSLHYRYSCIDGEVRGEVCGDRRTSVCSEEMVENTQTLEKSSKAICRPNLANECLNYNSLKTPLKRKELCEKNSDCYWSALKITTQDVKFIPYLGREVTPDNFNFGSCLPRVPIAYLKSDEKKTKKFNPEICWRANFRCPNDNCPGTSFADAITSMCISVSDCGPSANTEGRLTKEGYSVKGAKGISAKTEERLKSYSNPTNYALLTNEYVKSLLASYYGSQTQAQYNPPALAQKSILQMIRLKLSNKRQVYYCGAWQAPAGGEDCSKCSDNPLQPCTPYKCSTLGQSCELINQGTEDEVCADVGLNDKTTPTITPADSALSQEYSYTKVDNYNTRLSRSDGECILEDSQITLAVQTDEYAKCTFSLENNIASEEGDGLIGRDETYKTNHSVNITIPSVEQVAYESGTTLSSIELLEQEIQDSYNDLHFYIKCSDRAGNTDLESHVISTCVKPRATSNPPAIVKTIPAVDESIIFGTESSEVRIFTDFPATCKWSENKGKAYLEMENSFSCKTNISDIGIWGWECGATISPIRNDKSEFYFKCMNKPWLAEDYAKRKASETDFVYKLSPTKKALNITNIQPSNGNIAYSGIEPFDITLRFDTTGGANDGWASCKYSLNGGGMHYLFKTMGNTHSTRLSTMKAGGHTVDFECVDKIGNTATAQTSFQLALDNVAPKITRAYYSTAGLTVMTDEDSECAYNTTSCDFDFVNANKMLGVGKVHISEWNERTTYHIKCKDKYANPQSSSTCSIIIRAIE
jgi:hypothetical protein